MEIPAATSLLFGREHELEQIAEHLNDPDHRLVSLVGPGGIGKTSIGNEAARRYGDRTKDGAVFIDLQAVDQHELVVQRLADALNISIQDNDSALPQICRFLYGKETLLYFDNFEQVLEAAPVVANLLTEAPGTTILITSRSPLRLTQEWVLQVDGLPIPGSNPTDGSSSNVATQLFVDRAKRVRPDLNIEVNMSHIEKICQIVEGMPLAIEIAVSWAHLLECSEIEEELLKDHSILETSMRDIPDRHRSIDSIFRQSMSMLTPEERSVFENLSVFRGGFNREAAITVAGASLPILASLADRSLIRVSGDRRYRIHELVRQFAAELLAENDDGKRAIELSHSECFLKFLADRHVDLTIGKQVETAAEIEPDSENVRIAWQFAVSNSLSEQITSAATPYGQFIQYRGSYAIGGRTFAEAVAKYENSKSKTDETALASLLIEHGRFSLRQGRLDQAENAYAKAGDLHAKLGLKSGFGLLMDPQLGFAYLESTRGNIRKAVTLAEEVLARANSEDHQLHRAMANQLLGHLNLRQGNLNEARSHIQAALAECADQGENWFIAYCHNEQGEIEVALGNYEAATAHFTESLGISERFADRANIGLAQTCLGEVAALDGRHDDALNLFELNKSAYEQLGDTGGSARVESGLGALAIATGEYGSAYRHLKTVLETANEMQFVAMILDALEGIGELGLKTGFEHEGHQLLDYVDNHESTESRTRSRLKAIYNLDVQSDLSSGSLDQHVALAQTLLAELEKELKQEIATAVPKHQSTSESKLLPEPLTEREIEILERIAGGRPNQQIGDELFISLGTVKWYNNQIYTKLGVHNRTSAVAKARELNIIAAD